MEDNQEWSEKVAPRFRFTLWDLCTGFFPLVTLLPLLMGQFGELRQSPSTYFAPIGWLLLAGVVFWKGRGGVCVYKTRMAIAVSLLVTGMIVHLWAVIDWSFEWTHWAAVTYLVAWGLGRFRDTSWSQVVAWGGCLAMMTSIPIIENRLDVWINETTGALSSQTLDFYKVAHLWEQGRIYLEYGDFAVISAISPRLGLAATLWLTALWCCFRSRSFVHCLLLLLGVPAAVWACRYAAILLVSYAIQEHQENWATGTMHLWISLGALAISVFLILCWDQFLRAMLEPMPITDPTAMPVFAFANELIAWPHDTSETPIVSADPLAAHDYQPVAVQANLALPIWSTVDWRNHRLLKHAVFSCVALMLALFGLTAMAGLRSGLSPAVDILPSLSIASLSSVVSMELLPSGHGKFEKLDFHLQRQNSIEIETQEKHFISEASRLTSIANSGEDLQKTVGDPSPQLLELGSNDVGHEGGEVGPLIARWLFRWSDKSVAIELSAPHFFCDAPFDSESIQYSRRILQELIEPGSFGTSKRSQWNWYRCRTMGVYGEFSYLFQCGLNDDLSFDQLHHASTDARWQISKKLGRKKVDEQTSVKYIIRLFCDSGVLLTDKEVEELSEFFEQMRQSMRMRLEPNLLAKAIGDSR